MNIYYNKARDQLYKEHRLRILNAKSVLSTFKPKEPKKEREPSSLEDYLAEIVTNARPTQFTFTKSPESMSMTHIHTMDYLYARPKPLPKPRPKKLKSREIYFLKHNKVRKPREREMYMEDGQMHMRSRSTVDEYIPPKILQRYREMSRLCNEELLSRLLRPKIFLEFYSAKSEKNLGHLEIQLYTEACPAIVLEFVRMCTRGERERLVITQITEPISLECDLALTGVNTLFEDNLEHDTDTIDHGSGPGILSCPLRYVHGTRNSRLRFSITLRPLSVFNGKRVAFGKAFGDIRFLQRVQSYGKSKNNNLQIRVRTCGIQK